MAFEFDKNCDKTTSSEMVPIIFLYVDILKMSYFTPLSNIYFFRFFVAN